LLLLFGVEEEFGDAFFLLKCWLGCFSLCLWLLCLLRLIRLLARLAISPKLIK